jgi:hypothetical protein
MRTAAFASGVRGPVDFKALRRLASICLIVAIYVSLFFNRFLNQQRQLVAFTMEFQSFLRPAPVTLALIPTSVITVSRRGANPNHAYLTVRA